MASKNSTSQNHFLHLFCSGFCVLLAFLSICDAIASAQQQTRFDDEVSKEANGEFIEIRGVVTDTLGHPIDAAEITLPYAFNKTLRSMVSANTVSDPAGEFIIRIPRSHAVETDIVEYADSLLWCYAKHYCLGSFRVAKGKSTDKPQPVKVELAPATDTTFVVVDPDGQPAKDVLVEAINYKSEIGFSLVPDHLRSLLAKRTDDEGRIELPAFARDRLFKVMLTSGELGIQSQRFNPSVNEPAERKIQLRRVGRILVTVPNHMPEWTLRMKFALTTEAPMQAGQQRPPWPTEGVAEVGLDAFGRFRVPLIAEGRVRIAPIVDESLTVRPIIPKSIKVEAGQLAEFEIPMQELIQIEGSVIAGDTQTPLAGIKIHVYYGEYRQGTDVETDENGQFTASVLPGAVRFQLMNLYNTKYLQLGRPKAVQVSAEQFQVAPISVVLSEPRNGKVVNLLGAPVANARITAYYDNYLCSSATSDADGDFELPKMPTGVPIDQTSYRVTLEDGTTIYSRDVSIESDSPLVISAGL